MLECETRMALTTRKEYFKKRKGVKGVVSIIAVILVLFQLYTGLFGSLDALQQRCVHLGLGMLLVFLVYNDSGEKKSSSLQIVFNIGLIGATMAAIGYIFVNYDWVTFERFALITPLEPIEIILGVMFIITILEGARRVTGWSLVVVVLGFLAYPFVGPYLPGVLHSSPIAVTQVLDFLYLGTEGIFGSAIGASSTDIALFIVFGSLFVRNGGGELINNLASSIAGKAKGGPAKVAVIATSILGTFSGSGNANVATMGPVTIPMMRNTGFSSKYSAAVIAVASTGGQIMPPVMGAAAFVMASVSGMSYLEICKHAALPAILYYVGLYASVHIQAIKNDAGYMKTNVSNLKQTLLDYGHMLIPIIALILSLILGYTPRMAAGVAVITVIIASELKSTTRSGLWGLLEGFEDGAKGMLIVILATAAAGMIVGVIEVTALGQRLGAALLFLAGGNLLPVLVLGMVLGIVLGMGMPTTPAYIIQASTVIPALVQLGLDVPAAHMFAFYFACLSLITPPVALTSYTAAAIAKSSVWDTGWIAFRIGLPAYIVPFMFAYGPALLFKGSLFEITVASVTAIIGVILIAVAGEGYLMCPLTWYERLIAFAAALLLVAPSVKTIIPGLILVAILVILNKRSINKISKEKYVDTAEVN